MLVDNDDHWYVSIVLLITMASLDHAHSLCVLGVDIIATLRSNTHGNFTKLIEALTRADLLFALNGTTELTLFAPDNTAIDNSPPRYFDELITGNQQNLINALNYHLLNGIVSTATIGASKLPNLWNTKAAINAIFDKAADNKIRVNAATVTKVDITADNARIHVIDTVLIPLMDGATTLISAGNFTTLVALLNAADLLGSLQSRDIFTLFAPTDAALAKIPAGVVTELLKTENKPFLTEILKYHMAPQLLTTASINRLTMPANILTLEGRTVKVTKVGNTIKINDLITVTAPERFSTTGMIHPVDGLLLPPLDIVETAVMNGNFTTLIDVLGKAGMTNTLKGIGPFTLFAPSNAAFGKLSKAELDDLLEPANKEKLANLLKYHVVDEKKILTVDSKLPESLEMLAGGSATVVKENGNLKINEAAIILPALLSDNGIIYAVDTVLTLKPDLPSAAPTHGGPLGTLLSTLIFVYHACL